MKALRLLLLGSVVACTLGEGQRLADSEYYVVRSDAVQTYIVRRPRNTPKKATIAIESTVLDYKVSNTLAAVARQVVKNYECDERTIVTEIFDAFEYWIIDLKASDITGPLTWAQHHQLLSQRLGGSSLVLPKEEILRRSKAMRPHPLMECTNPQEIR